MPGDMNDILITLTAVWHSIDWKIVAMYLPLFLFALAMMKRTWIVVRYVGGWFKRRWHSFTSRRRQRKWKRQAVKDREVEAKESRYAKRARKYVKAPFYTRAEADALRAKNPDANILVEAEKMSKPEMVDALKSMCHTVDAMRLTRPDAMRKFTAFEPIDPVVISDNFKLATESLAAVAKATTVTGHEFARAAQKMAALGYTIPEYAGAYRHQDSFTLRKDVDIPAGQHIYAQEPGAKIIDCVGACGAGIPLLKSAEDPHGRGLYIKNHHKIDVTVTYEYDPGLIVTDDAVPRYRRHNFSHRILPWESELICKRNIKAHDKVAKGLIVDWVGIDTIKVDNRTDRYLTFNYQYDKVTEQEPTPTYSRHYTNRWVPAWASQLITKRNIGVDGVIAKGLLVDRAGTDTLNVENRTDNNLTFKYSYDKEN